MVRCSECGRRLRDAHPVCAVHGAKRPSQATAEVTVDTPEPDLVAGFTGLGYRITRVLGRGGFGTVYGAESARDGRKVAIKVALREAQDGAERLRREAQALERVGPPHVPAVFDRGVNLGQCYAVIELIAEKTLAEVLEDATRPFTLEELSRLARALTKTVESIHAAGLVHRDLKPENLFVRADYKEVRAIDFGLAREIRQQGSLEATSEDDVGTAEYMSPEQCEGLADADPRSDVYSIGVLLYELVAGAPPFWGIAADVREAHRSRRPGPLTAAGCPPALDQVIRRCLAKDRARRYDDVATLRNVLHEVFASLSAVSTSDSQVVPVLGAPRKEDPQRTTAAQPARQKQTVGLVFFESRAGVAAVQPALTAAGGQIVQTNGAQYVGAFGHDAGDNPARVALMAARRLLSSKLTTRLLVDVATVSVQLRPDGSRRVFSPVFARKDRMPTNADPLGVLLTGAALEVLPHLKVSPVDGSADRFALDLAPAPAEPTTFGVQLAPLVGRDDVLGSLSASARRAFDESMPTLATVVAEGGYGRSHLAGVLAQVLDRAHPGAEVVRLAAQEGLVGAVSQTLPDLLRRLLVLPNEAPEDGGRALLHERLEGGIAEQTWAAAALALGWIDAEHPDVRRLAAAPGALRLAAARAAGEALRQCARRTPVAVVLDDAHLADEAMLDALEYASLAEASARVFLCALVRPAFQRARPAWGSRAGTAPRVNLSPLSLVEASELARRLLLPVEHVPPTVLARLAERTQGVPRLLVELVRGLKRDGLVKRSERGMGYYLATEALDKLPDIPIVQWNAIREVDALSPQLAGHARLASVLGASFTVPEVEALLSMLELEGLTDELDLDASVGIQRLVEASVLVRHRAGRIEFRHSLLRGTIYQTVPEDRRKRLHGAAYRMYQGFAMPEEQRLPRLALHAAASGERDAAASAYLALAARAERAHAYLEADAAFGGALENLPTTGDLRAVTALRGRGLMRFRLGRHEDAVKDLRSARLAAEALGSRAEVLELCLDEAMVLDWTQDLEQSAELVRRVEHDDLARTPLLAARLAMGVARVHHRHGETALCVQRGAEAIELARQLGDEGYETRVIALMMVGPDCAGLGRFDDAGRYFDDAIASAESRSDLMHLGGAHMNRALLWYEKKDIDRLFHDLTRAIQIAREAGLPLLEYIVTWNFAEASYAVEQLDRASEHVERAIALSRQLWGEESREYGLGQLFSARIALYRGDLAEARSVVAALRARLAALSPEQAAQLAFAPGDQLILDAVDLASRNAAENEWEQLSARNAGVELQLGEELESLEARALTAFRNGLVDLSGSLFAKALEMSASNSNLLGDRVRRKKVALFG
ncbi:MAG: protein kinase [Polyangiales bacterium]